MNSPIAVTIAGSDSGGGAGIQADLKTFSAYRVFGAVALTCVTAQNPKEVTDIHAIPPSTVTAQLKAIWDWTPVSAIKTGMLYSEELILTIGKFLDTIKISNLVVDPVMVATSGSVLLQSSAIEALKHEILPKASVITPNIGEAQILADEKIDSLKKMKDVALKLSDLYKATVVVKGGHLPHNQQAVDVVADKGSIWELISPWLDKKNAHGTGCTFSSAIAAGLAKEWPLEQSLKTAKQYLTASLQESFDVEGEQTLWHFPTMIERI